MLLFIFAPWFYWGLGFAAGFGAACVLGFVENKTVLRRLGRIVRHSQRFDKGRQFSLHLGRLKTVFSGLECAAFLGKGAEAMAGIAERKAGTADDIAFGGRKQ
ncbi:hypothetical protein [Neisseria bacilliformis]|uniref:hypothetical protein n=1 Tax=Neisseria bacilliformis TaxID=267212 RepID=UPI0028E459EB|nr:hypothetical protein [Neisseria bacilliformis]